MIGLRVQRWNLVGCVCLLLLLVAGCVHNRPVKGKRITGVIRPEWVGTEKARLSGYFTSPDPDFELVEGAPGEVPHQAVLDEATLAVTDEDQTCIDVVIRTSETNDEPLSQLNPRIVIGDHEEVALVSNEKVSTKKYQYQYIDSDKQEALSLSGIIDLKLTKSGPEKVHTDTEVVVERRGRYCVPIPATRPVMLKLTQPNMGLGAEDHYRLNFEWRSR